MGKASRWACYGPSSHPIRFWRGYVISALHSVTNETWEGIDSRTYRVHIGGMKRGRLADQLGPENQVETTWQRNFKTWQDFAARIRQRAETADKMRADRGWALAASVGIPRCGCSLHNAAIDDEMRGWCAGNPLRLKVAKRANHIISDSRISRLADSIISRAYSRMVHD